jgi:hypothetical protein
LNFLPWLPYALDPSDQNFPDNKSCAQSNRSYYDAAQTPNDIFWGWTRFFNVMDVILTKAANTTPTRINVEALDYYNESNLGFTVEARMIYDDFRGVNVLQALRDRMSAHSYDSARVAPSANQGVPAFASSDCGSFFGDSAMLMPLSQLTAALAGPGTKFGTPPFEPMFNEIVQAEEPSLPCLITCEPPESCDPYDDSANRMISLPVSYSQPTFILHRHPLPGGASALAKTDPPLLARS